MSKQKEAASKRVKQVFSRKSRILTPGEMVTLKLMPSVLQQISSAGSVTVKVEVS